MIKVPKAIRSLKSYFIRITSQLCIMGGQRPCSNTIAPCHYGNISHFNVQLLFPAAGHNCPCCLFSLLMKTYGPHRLNSQLALRYERKGVTFRYPLSNSIDEYLTS